MKQRTQMCPRCPHPFHAKAQCTMYDSGRQQLCDCEGFWHEESRAISGFCYILFPVSRDAEQESHLQCPGPGYVYPCECDCHSLLDADPPMD